MKIFIKNTTYEQLGSKQEDYLKHSAINDLDEVIRVHRASLALRPEGHPDRGSSLHDLALCLSERFKTRNAMADLDEAIEFSRAALEHHPPGHRLHPVSLNTLTMLLRDRISEPNSMDDLDRAIRLHRAALDLCSEGHRPDRSSLLHGLLSCLNHRFDKFGVVTSVDEIVKVSRAVLNLHPPGEVLHSTPADNLAKWLRHRFIFQHTTDDLNEAIHLYQAALDLRPEGHTDRIPTLHNLALCFRDRFKNLNVSVDLDEALKYANTALALCPPGHVHRALSLTALAVCFHDKFHRQDVIDDLDEAARLHKAALELRPGSHPDRASSLHDLALCLSDRFDKLGILSDVDEAIRLARAALDLRPSKHPHRAVTLSNLATYLQDRFWKQDVVDDLNEAISLHRTALGLRPVGHPDRALSLHDLALCLNDRFKRYNELADLDKAIKFARAALDFRPPGHDLHLVSLRNLASFLKDRFLQNRTTDDLDEAIQLQRTVLALRPEGHPDRASLLHDLALCLSDRFNESHALADLEEAIDLAHAVVELRPPGHSYHTISLYNLATYLKGRFFERGTIEDLDKAIALHKEVLEVRPLGELHQSSSLHSLMVCLRGRFHKTAAGSDLDAAICFGRAALELRAQRHPDRFMSLYILSACHHDRFTRQNTILDLEETITLAKAALELSPPPGFNQSFLLENLSSYLQQGMEKLDTMADLEEAATLKRAALDGQSQVKQAVWDLVLEAIAAVPPRLLDTHTGVLCDRAAQILQFECSAEYLELLATITGWDSARVIKNIRETVAGYFQYVTLSHRWGKEEPSLGDVKGHVIYDVCNATDGLTKLQAFCRTARQHGYRWAWSDTCCIDKNSSAELQQAIGSMFSWYRQSTLTIVYLSDVSNSGELPSSVWFKRGWTLQELLAPRTVLFYTRDWTPYHPSSNHKNVRVVLLELERATGISAEHLTDFCPGMTDPRLRLQWASTRRTTQPEDTAYSLFGIFRLHLPVLYGESKENALGRLLAEIISQSGDISVLDWVGKASLFHSCFPASITSYQMISLEPFLGESPIVCQSSLMSSIRKLRTQWVAHKKYKALASLPLPQFASRRLTLPCIVHRVTTVLRKPGDHLSTQSYIYELHAVGLKALRLTLLELLEDGSGAKVPYILIRPWHPKLLSGLSSSCTEAKSAAAYRRLAQLQQPFHALLLTKLPHNEYRRIASYCLIVARPIDTESIVESEVTTLVIA